MTKLCSVCGTENRDEAQFCRACGTTFGLAGSSTDAAAAPAGMTCAECGFHNKPGVRYCANCGVSLLAGAAPAEPEAAAPGGQRSLRRAQPAADLLSLVRTGRAVSGRAIAGLVAARLPADLRRRSSAARHPRPRRRDRRPRAGGARPSRRSRLRRRGAGSRAQPHAAHRRHRRARARRRGRQRLVVPRPQQRSGRAGRSGIGAGHGSAVADACRARFSTSRHGGDTDRAGCLDCGGRRFRAGLELVGIVATRCTADDCGTLAANERRTGREHCGARCKARRGGEGAPREAAARQGRSRSQNQGARRPARAIRGRGSSPCRTGRAGAPPRRRCAAVAIERADRTGAGARHGTQRA